MTCTPLSVLIVGCGNIAGGTGLVSLEGEALSHAAAYTSDGRFEITACVDPDPVRRTSFAQNWNAAYSFEDLESALASDTQYDIASVCVPTNQHANTLWKLLDSPVNLVLCEKPLTVNVDESQRLVRAYADAEKPLAVAFLRRWHRAAQDIADELSAGSWGAVRSVHIRYSRGIRHTGSHVIDLMHQFLGPLTVRYAGNPRYDFDKGDPTIDAILTNNEAIPVHLIGHDGRDFALLEVELLTAKGAITLEDWGTRIRRRHTVAFRHAPDILTLDDGTWQGYGAGAAFEAMIDNVYRTATSGAPLLSDGANAVAAERLIEELIARSTGSGDAT